MNESLPGLPNLNNAGPVFQVACNSDNPIVLALHFNHIAWLRTNPRGRAALPVLIARRLRVRLRALSIDGRVTDAGEAQGTSTSQAHVEAVEETQQVHEQSRQPYLIRLLHENLTRYNGLQNHFYTLASGPVM
jgi:hypothetical protein